MWEIAESNDDKDKIVKKYKTLLKGKLCNFYVSGGGFTFPCLLNCVQGSGKIMCINDDGAIESTVTPIVNLIHCSKSAARKLIFSIHTKKTVPDKIHINHTSFDWLVLKNINDVLKFAKIVENDMTDIIANGRNIINFKHIITNIRALMETININENKILVSLLNTNDASTGKNKILLNIVTEEEARMLVYGKKYMSVIERKLASKLFKIKDIKSITEPGKSEPIVEFDNEQYQQKLTFYNTEYTYTYDTNTDTTTYYYNRTR